MSKNSSGIFFSIVIPLFNKEATIRRTIQSILEQSYKDFIIVLSDDGSTDNSREVVKAIEDDRIHLFSYNNSGPGAARNKGVERSIELVGEDVWIIFLDADDSFLPGALQLFADEIVAHPNVEMITANFYLSCNGTHVLYGKNRRSVYIKNPFRSSFFRTLSARAGSFTCEAKLLSQVPHNDSLRRFEDVEMLRRLYHTVGVIYQSPQPVMMYNEDYSYARTVNNIETDYLGQLSFNERMSFWEKVYLWEYYILAKNFFPEESKKIYADVEATNRGFMIIYHALYRIRQLLAIVGKITLK